MCRAVFLALAAFATAPSVFASLGFINFDGYWGTWGRMQVSSSRSYATRFKVRTESAQRSGDDTALNAICLIFNGEPPCAVAKEGLVTGITVQCVVRVSWEPNSGWKHLRGLVMTQLETTSSYGVPMDK